MVKILVQDNGIGFKVDQLELKTKEHSHFGLIGMWERVELLDGRMEIESAANMGTKIVIHIPTNTDKREE